MEQQFYINDIADWEVSVGVYVLVRIVEVKKQFGKYYYCIKPFEGRGHVWVERLTKPVKRNAKNNKAS